MTALADTSRLSRHLLAQLATAVPDWAGILTSQAGAWQALKSQYRPLYLHELAHAEEGPRAGAYGWGKGVH